jgi:hypothetical protein
VEGGALASPPANPPIGACYLVADGASGEWAGQEKFLAAFTEGGWRFVAPVEGARVLDRASGQTIIYRNAAWETGIIRAREVWIDGLAVLRERQPAIVDPAGGSVVDSECRDAVAAILAAMRVHGLID